MAEMRNSRSDSEEGSDMPRCEILKIGLAVTNQDRLVVVRKKGGRSYILPGGKPEMGEDDFQALSREIEEELGCQLEPGSLVFLGSFSDTAADKIETTVIVRLYEARLLGEPTPHSEIERLKWFDPEFDNGETLAPSLQNHIVPFLVAHGRLRQP